VRKNLLVLVVLFCFGCLAGWSQGTPPPPATEPVPATTTMPTDPAELIKLADEMNGLDIDKLAPWHLKATFQLYDLAGKPTEQGTYEEFWAPKKHKRIYTAPSFTRTEWETEDGKQYSSQTGGALPPRMIVGLIRSSIVDPVPSAAYIRFGELSKRTLPVGTVTLVCVSISYKNRPGGGLVAREGSYCFADDKPILRISIIYGGIQSVTNAVGVFQNRHVAKSLSITAFGKPLLDLKVDSLSSLTSIQGSDFDPPDEIRNKHSNAGTSAPGQVTAGRIRSKFPPIYPVDAKRRGVKGVVLLEGLIGKDGHLSQIRPIASPDPDLTEAALDAVKKWEYEPYLLNGAPVVVDTVIDVVFNLAP
jgi:TonB family protein